MGWREQLFTSPGTWTNPGSITSVRVLLVGGGGGSNGSVGSGSGALIERVTQISGPQPVIVGSGGSAATGPGVPATLGGSSTFGAPGPTQLIAGPGGAGGAGATNNAPPTGGGGGAPFGTGTLGYPGGSTYGGGMAGLGGNNNAGPGGVGNWVSGSWAWFDGKYRFAQGGGGSTDGLLSPDYSGNGGYNAGSPGAVIVRWYE